MGFKLRQSGSSGSSLFWLSYLSFYHLVQLEESPGPLYCMGSSFWSSQNDIQSLPFFDEKNTYFQCRRKLNLQVECVWERFNFHKRSIIEGSRIRNHTSRHANHQLCLYLLCTSFSVLNFWFRSVILNQVGIYQKHVDCVLHTQTYISQDFDPGGLRWSLAVYFEKATGSYYQKAAQQGRSRFQVGTAGH